ESFMAHDLKKPVRLGRQFDLVLSLEVAEHLPAEFAGTYVESLVKLGPIVLFSAAIPFQGGAEHVNEQWPDYWIEHFLVHEYVAIDCLRPRIWQNPQIKWWYAQNLLMFANKTILQQYPALAREYDRGQTVPLNLVHPQNYFETIRWTNKLLGAIEDLGELIPSGEAFVLADEAALGNSIIAGRRAFPFTQHDGGYNGPPADDETAIRELQRLHRQGASFMVFAWPAFWWLDFYEALHRYLRTEFTCILENERVVVFDLRHESRANNGS